jgi:hypothetical protein
VIGMAIYLVCLEFRTPPFNVQFWHPNIQSSAPIVLDGAFSFLERFNGQTDWRMEYLTKQFEKISHSPPSIQTSYLFPSIQEGNSLKFTTPSGACLTFEISGKATLTNISQVESSNVPFFLRLRRQFDFSSVMRLMDTVESIEIKRKKGKIDGISTIDEGRGPYKGISLELQVKACHLLWCAFAESSDKSTLKRYLEFLTINGIGKKRNLGWGDLKNFEVFDLEPSSSGVIPVDRLEYFSGKEQFLIFVDRLEYFSGKEQFLETIRPKELKDIQTMLKSGKRETRTLLGIQIGHGATEPPYWGKGTVVHSAKIKRVEGKSRQK